MAQDLPILTPLDPAPRSTPGVLSLFAVFGYEPTTFEIRRMALDGEPPPVVTRIEMPFVRPRIVDPECGRAMLDDSGLGD